MHAGRVVLTALSCPPLLAVALPWRFDDSTLNATRLRPLYSVIPKAQDEPRDRRGQWHSQHSQDCFVQQLLGGRRGGFFIDLASNDALRLSNSRALERDYGWRGLCIEPNPKYHAGLLRHRSCAVIGAAVADTEEENFFQFQGDAHSRSELDQATLGRLNRNSSRRDKGMPVWTLPLRSVMQAFKVPAVIDYMSLDVEGAEELVLRSFPWETHRISVLSVETPRAPVVDLLEKHGYSFICGAGGPQGGYKRADEIWVHWESMKRDSHFVRALTSNAPGVKHNHVGMPYAMAVRTAPCYKTLNPHASLGKKPKLARSSCVCGATQGFAGVLVESLQEKENAKHASDAEGASVCTLDGPWLGASTSAAIGADFLSRS